MTCPYDLFMTSVYSLLQGCHGLRFFDLYDGGHAGHGKGPHLGHDRLDELRRGDVVPQVEQAEALDVAPVVEVGFVLPNVNQEIRIGYIENKEIRNKAK